ncbi:hypothetical protein MRSR164_05480 [Methylobacterium radiotolerans]|uniref:Uncharacterized protein n=1 Tax=Methylobacterium radiotolerans TaxID=31998 RepID=A0ABU7T6T9_9HYPH
MSPASPSASRAGDLAKRLKRAERLTAVQEQMRRAAEWQLAQTRRDAEAVEADRAALLASVGSSAHGPLRGGGHALDDAAVARLPLAGGLAEVAAALGEALAATFGEGSPADP